MGGGFQPATFTALTGLPAGAVPVVWTQHPDDPQHVMLVHRPSSGDGRLGLVETQADAGERYTVVDSENLRGVLQLPVNEQGQLLWVQENTGVGSSPVPMNYTNLAAALLDPSESARPGMRPRGGHGHSYAQGQPLSS